MSSIYFAPPKVKVSFVRLPMEVRLMIYDYEIPTSIRVCFDFDTRPYQSEMDWDPVWSREDASTLRAFLSLAATCRDLRRELIPLLYVPDTFSFHYKSHVDKWLDRLTAESRASFQRLEIFSGLTEEMAPELNQPSMGFFQAFSNLRLLQLAVWSKTDLEAEIVDWHPDDVELMQMIHKYSRMRYLRYEFWTRPDYYPDHDMDGCCELWCAVDHEMIPAAIMFSGDLDTREVLGEEVARKEITPLTIENVSTNSTERH